MKNNISIKQILSDWRFVFIVYVFVTAVATLIKFNLGSINNFIIYRNSFYHLIHHQSLYSFYPAEQFDQFLYGPFFTVFIAPFALLPVQLGVLVWCLFNAATVFFAIYFLRAEDAKRNFMWWFVLIELITSVQNVQINPMIGALFVFAYLSFENNKPGSAAFFIVLSTFLKVFGVLGAALFLFYPNKPKFILYGMLWSVVLFASPLLFVSVNELSEHYNQWINTLLTDRTTNVEDISIMHFISHILHADVERIKSYIQVIAVVMFFPKFLMIKKYDNGIFRKLTLSSVMIWSVIFSHAAESSTYIIAVLGIAIWLSTETKNQLVYLLTAVVIIFSILAPTDIYPRSIRVEYFVPYAVKAFPCFLVWMYIEYKLLFVKQLN